MLDTGSDLGLNSPVDAFSVAYQRLVDDLEQALGIEESGGVADAYQAYARVCEQALADAQVQQRVTDALTDITSALGRAFERPGTRAAVDHAARSYLADVGAAWAEMNPDGDAVDAMMAVATGMTTLAWMFGLGSNPFVTPFGLVGDGWGGEPGHAHNGAGPSFTEPAEPSQGHSAFSVEDSAQVSDDANDGIVWQEFDVGADGEIVQRPAPPPRPAAAAPPPRPPASSAAPLDAGARERPTGSPSGRAASRPAARGGDPIDRVRQAYAAYADGLDALGLAGASPAADERTSRAEHDDRTAELLAAYLRLVGGSGTWHDLYTGQARLAMYVNELLERQIALARRYEQLIDAALDAGRPDRARRASEDGYRRLVATIRDAWSEIDPARTSPEALAELAEMTGRAAKLHETAQAGRRRRAA